MKIMNTASAARGLSRRIQRAFTLAEVMITVGFVSVAFLSLCLGMSGGFAMTKHARENLRATQIMLERLEGIRLYNWNQLCYSNMIPTTFTSYYYPFATNAADKGIVYSGTMTVGTATLNPPVNYSDQLRAIVVTLTWTNKTGKTSQVVRQRSMTAYSAKYGVQNYVFYN